MKDYVVNVRLKSEAISLGADNQDEAISKAWDIIAEQYGQSVANDAIYSTGDN